MNSSKLLGAFALFLSCSALTNAQQLLSHDFNDGRFGPYEVNKSDQESRVYIRNGAIETHWEESKYDGTNSGRKAQFRPIGWDPNNWEDGFYFQKELWMGFDLKVGSDYMRDNTNADACFMQIWGNQGSNLGNHYAMLKFDGRNGGELTWYNRWCCGTASEDHWLVERGFPRDQFVSVIIHVNLSSNGSAVRIWLDGELALSTSGQRMGWGELNASGMINDSYSTLSLGQYNYRENPGTGRTYYDNAHFFNGHLNNETRTVTYDNLSLYNGSNGYDIVNPSDDDDNNNGGSTGGTSDFEPDTNRNYYIDNPRWAARLAANGGDRPYAKSPTANFGRLVQWQFTPAPTEGYYYIDGVGGEDNSRLCTDLSDYADVKSDSWGGSWTQWKITDAGNGLYHLTTLAEGNSRLQVDEASNIRMMTTNSTGSWTQFEITEVPSSREAKSLVDLDSDFATVYPNPLTSSTTIEGAEGATISIYDMTGATVYQGLISSGSETISLSGLATGVYYAKINGAGKLDIVKLIKQ